MVDVHHYQAGGFLQAVAAAAGEHSAGGDVGQCLLLQEAAGVIVAAQGGVSNIERQCGEAFVGSDQVVDFVQVHCPQRCQRGTFHGFSGCFVLYRRDGRHEERHFEFIHFFFLF